jgi:hypothetical protein
MMTGVEWHLALSLEASHSHSVVVSEALPSLADDVFLLLDS